MSGSANNFSLKNPDNLVSMMAQSIPEAISSAKAQKPFSNIVPLKKGITTEANSDAQGEVFDDWDEEYRPEFEDLLFSNLYDTFQLAMNQLIKCGMIKEGAEMALVRLGLYNGGNDLVFNMVYDTLLLAKSGKDVMNTRDVAFVDLKQHATFAMLELVNTLREVKPSLSTMEAIWWLLLCDGNIKQACDLQDFLGDATSREASKASSFSSAPGNSQSETIKDFNNDILGQTKLGAKEVPIYSAQSSTLDQLQFGSFTGIKGPCILDTLASDKRNSISTRGSSKKSLDPTAEIMKTTANKTSSSAGIGKASRRSNKKDFSSHKKSSYADINQKNHEKTTLKSTSVSSVSSPSSESRSIPLSESSNMINISSEVDANVVESLLVGRGFQSDSRATISASKPEDGTSSSLEQVNYGSGIPHDKSPDKHTTQDEKDALLLDLVPRVYGLRTKIEKWNYWANLKIMQATSRLSQDMPELKALRQEWKERKNSKESVKKTTSEIEMSLTTIICDCNKANSIIYRLQQEQIVLQNRMEDEKFRAEKLIERYQEELEREQQALKESQLSVGDKRLLQNELKILKQKVTKLFVEAGKEKDRRISFQDRYRTELKTKEHLLTQAALIKKQQEQKELAAQEEFRRIIEEAEIEIQVHMKINKELEKEISELKWKFEADKIAALRMSMTNHKYPNSTTNQSQGSRSSGSAAGGLISERECVMCFVEEISIVFLPCAHQVLCTKCNELHEKRGIKDCPSCRTPIQKRILARYSYP